MRQILSWISLNGAILSHEEAKISTLSPGLLYGEGIFTTLKVREGAPLFFEKHKARLEDSLKQLCLPKTTLPQDLQTSVVKIIEKNKIQDGGLRITLTRDMCLIHVTTIAKEIEKVAVITTPDTRDQYRTLKITYRVPHRVAQKKAEEQHAQDALFTEKNNLIESTYANIFVYSSGKIITPPITNKGLNGISRQILMDQLPIEEAEIPSFTVDPMVLVSCLSMRIVTRVDERTIKEDKKFVHIMQTAIETAEKKYLQF